MVSKTSQPSRLHGHCRLPNPSILAQTPCNVKLWPQTTKNSYMAMLPPRQNIRARSYGGNKGRGARTRSVMPHLRGGLTSRKEWGQNVLARAEVRMADNKFKREEWDRVLREGPSCLGSQASGQKVRLQRGPSCFRNGVVNGLAVGGPGQAAPIIRSDGLLRHLGFLASPSEADLPVPSAACWRCWSSHPARVTA